MHAILARHGENLRRRRAALFERAVLDRALGDIQRIAEMMVRPLAEELEGGDDALDFIIIVAEVVADPHRAYTDLEVLYEDPLVPEVSRLLASLAELPADLLGERVVTAVFQSIDAVATRARRMRVQSPRPMVGTEVFITNLVDMLVGAITVQPSARTLAALADRKA